MRSDTLCECPAPAALVVGTAVGLYGLADYIFDIGESLDSKYGQHNIFPKPMKKKAIKTWMKIGYSAMMFLERKEKPHDWEGRLKYVFNTYLFFLFTALFANFFLALFPFKEWHMIFYYILLIIIAIYTFGYNKLYKKLVIEMDFDPSVNYKKNSFRDFISAFLMLTSFIITFLSFVFSFYIFNYFKYIIGGVFK